MTTGHVLQKTKAGHRKNLIKLNGIVQHLIAVPLKLILQRS